MEKVDLYIKKCKKWKEETILLRKICLECELEEDFKWMHPCYTKQGKNIVLIHGFKDYCALLFHKGALLKDTKDILIQQTENSQIARQLRFTDIEEIESLKKTIKAYIKEAINNEIEGKVVQLKKTSEYEKTEELIYAFDEDPDFKEAFHKLTPGRQRGYLLHFSEAKQSKTRTSRIEKAKPKILEGKGYNER